jgi:Protein of unknown function (DUF982)
MRRSSGLRRRRPRMNMILRTAEVRWLAPVYVRIGYGLPEAVRSPRQALEKLLYRWPQSRGHAYERAMRSCMESAQRKQATETAREDFIQACIEALTLD